MTKSRISAIMVMMFAIVSMDARAEHTRITNPSALSVEGLGRGLTWSANFDRVVTDDIAGGVGFGTASLTTPGSSLISIPFYLNYYLTRDAGSLYFTGGLTVVTGGNAADQTTLGKIGVPDSGIMPTFGLGYENRGDSGFLLRVTAYGLVGDTLKPWVGFTFGYAF